MDPQGQGGRVSRAGRRLRSVGEWWREPRRSAQNDDDSGRRTESARPKNAGWIPAFEKTLIGSGPGPAGIKKHRSRNRLARKLVPGAGFIRCVPAQGKSYLNMFGQDADEPSPLDAKSPQLHTPCHYDADALASALRAQKMQDDTGTTPTRRVLNIYSSPSPSSKSNSETQSMTVTVETASKPSISGFLPLSSAGADLRPQK